MNPTQVNSSPASNNNGTSGDDSTVLQCYNISCGLKYREEDNQDDSCIFHEGKPYFHDGYKEWTCCKMKSRDFTIFMGFKGCTKGRHNNVKPVEPPKPESTIDLPQERSSPESSNGEEVVAAPAQSEVTEFTPPDASLVQAIKIVESPNVATAPAVKNIVICKNCKAEESTLDLSSECRYHRGIQVFHDSLKFWSCCPHKKFTEFEEFQKLPPCAGASTHELMVKVDYKENWFQTGGTLTIALYGLKGARALEGKATVSLTGGRQLSVRLVNASGITIFENEWLLKDYVLPESSKVVLNPSNVQIVLQKANSRHHWPALVEKKAPQQQESEKATTTESS